MILLEAKMSGRFVALCALGLAGSLFLGYCVYFDRKRRMDPDYKKKVLARELNTLCSITNLTLAEFCTVVGVFQGLCLVQM